MTGSRPSTRGERDFDPALVEMILAQGRRSEIDAAIAEDPFAQHGVAQHTVTEFVPTMTGDELAAFKE